MTGFETKCISHSYEKGKPILDRFTMSCVEGSVNVILGLNGCGKTTALKVMAGLIEPKEGEVMFYGRDLLSLSDKERSKYIAYVKQHGNHISDYTVRDYLLFSTVNSLRTFQEPGEDERNRVDRCLLDLGITELEYKRIGDLSGGQRQLVNICAALVQNSRIILLDEPTSALDKNNENLVLELLRSVAANSGKTIILTTHDPNHALYLGAEVFLMKGGRIIDSGTGSEIVNKDRLRPVYGDGICYSDELPYREVSYKGA